MESFNLNIIPGKDRPVCHASQFDIGRTIHVNLFEGFNVFTLDGTEVISISVRKPDGNVVTEAVTNTSDSYVEFVTTEQMTACSGSNLCELKLEKGADVIGTMNFILEVEQDPLDGGVQSDTQIHNLQTQVADLVAIEVADQYDSADVIFDNTPTAGHGVGYAVTSEGVKNAIDAAVGTVEDIAADAYDENNSYTAGDYCIYSDVLYKCNGSTTGTFDPSKWDATTIADEFISIISDINTKQDSLYGGTISTTDFDTLKKAKVYYVNGSSTVYNAPFDSCYGMLEVLETAVPLQRFTSAGANRTGGVWEREYINNAWTSWVNARNRPILLVATENATLPANTTTVVNYTFTVPNGYSIVSAYDDSYYAGLVASPIRIATGSGSKVVSFNYFATTGQTHTYTARALALPDVNVMT